VVDLRQAYDKLRKNLWKTYEIHKILCKLGPRLFFFVWCILFGYWLIAGQNSSQTFLLVLTTLSRVTESISVDAKSLLIGKQTVVWLVAPRWYFSWYKPQLLSSIYHADACSLLQLNCQFSVVTTSVNVSCMCKELCWSWWHMTNKRWTTQTSYRLYL